MSRTYKWGAYHNLPAQKQALSTGAALTLTKSVPTPGKSQNLELVHISGHVSTATSIDILINGTIEDTFKFSGISNFNLDFDSEFIGGVDQDIAVRINDSTDGCFLRMHCIVDKG